MTSGKTRYPAIRRGPHGRVSAILPWVSFPTCPDGMLFLLEDSGRHRNLLKSVSIDRYRAAFFRLLAPLNFHFSPIFLSSPFLLSFVRSRPSALLPYCRPLPPPRRKTTDRSFRRARVTYSVNATIYPHGRRKNTRKAGVSGNIPEKMITSLSYIISG